MKALSIDEVSDRVGLSRSTIWRYERRGDFPPRRKLGPNRVAWLEGEVEDWLQARPAAGVDQTGAERETRVS